MKIKELKKNDLIYCECGNGCKCIAVIKQLVLEYQISWGGKAANIKVSKCSNPDLVGNDCIIDEDVNFWII